jgi:acyl-CoA dehydrogenase
VPVDHEAILCDPRPIAIADPTTVTELAELRGEYRAFMDEHVLPAEAALSREDDAAQELIRDLRARAKSEGLWAPHLPPDAGGTGRGFLAYAHLNEEIGRTVWAQYVFNCQAPDAGNGEILHLFGTDEQKERWLKPLVEGDARSFFSMTEPDVSGADPTGLKTTARLEGDEWVIDGHKWFSSGAEDAAFGIVMAVTEPDEQPHRRMSQIVVPADAAGIEIEPVRTLGHRGRGWSTHCEVRYTGVRVPAGNLLGERGDGFRIAQKRLGPGRIHHVMRWLGQMQRAFELMCGRALEREAFGGPLADKQTVQNWIADSAAEIQACRLMTLDAARKIDGGSEARVEISLIKFYAARVLSDVIDRAVQVHGALGLTDRSPLSAMYMMARGAHIYDGPDEVHRMVVSRRILKAFADGGRWEFS